MERPVGEEPSVPTRPAAGDSGEAQSTPSTEQPAAPASPPTVEPPPSARATYWHEPPPLHSRLGAVSFVAAVVAVIAVGVYLEVGSPRFGAPGARTTPRPSAATGTTRSPVGSTAVVASFEPARIAEIEEQVEAIRGLEAMEDVPIRVVGLDELEDDVRGFLERPAERARIERETEMLSRLGFMPRGLDLVALSVAGARADLAGYFDPVTATITIVAREPELGPFDELTLAHEYVHALQAQHFGVEIAAELHVIDSDRDLTVRSLLEGDAELASAAWAEEHAPAALAGALLPLEGELAPVPAELAPGILAAQADFPYLYGIEFVDDLWSSGGWDAVDAAYRAPPVSSEQILDPARYPGERPIPIEALGVDHVPGGPWTQDLDGRIGALTIYAWLSGEVGDPLAEPVATGWGGDLLTGYHNEDGDWLVVWQTTWDTDADSREFQRAAQSTLAGREAFRLVRPDQWSLAILVASDGALVQEAWQALYGG